MNTRGLFVVFSCIFHGAKTESNSPCGQNICNWCIVWHSSESQIGVCKCKHVGRLESNNMCKIFWDDVTWYMLPLLRQPRWLTSPLPSARVKKNSPLFVQLAWLPSFNWLIPPTASCTWNRMLSQYSGNAKYARDTSSARFSLVKKVWFLLPVA